MILGGVFNFCRARATEQPAKFPAFFQKFTSFSFLSLIVLLCKMASDIKI